MQELNFQDRNLIKTTPNKNKMLICAIIFTIINILSSFSSIGLSSYQNNEIFKLLNRNCSLD